MSDSMVEPTDPDSPSQIFAAYVQAREAGEDVDFEATCKQHPQHADELRRLRTYWRELGGVMDKLIPSGTLTERIKEKYGSEADPNVSLEGERRNLAMKIMLDSPIAYYQQCDRGLKAILHA